MIWISNHTLVDVTLTYAGIHTCLNYKMANVTINTSVTEPLSHFLLDVFAAVRIIEGTLSLLGNSLTIYAISKYDYLKTISNIFIIHLAISDILYFPGAIFYAIVNYDMGMSENQLTICCQMYNVLYVASIYGNSFGIIIIGYERCFYIARPLKYDIYMTENRAKFVLAILWCFILFICLMYSYGLQLANGHCIVEIPPRRHEQMYICISQVVIYINLVFPYIIIFCVAYKKSTGTIYPSDPSRTVSSNALNIIKMAACVLGIYIICTLPVGLVITLVAVGLVHWEEFYHYSTVLRAISSINCWVNPLIYCWRSSEFRKAFLSILRKCQSQEFQEGRIEPIQSPIEY